MITTDPTVAAIRRDDLVRWLDTLLAPVDENDFCPNGLQVEGPDVVSHVVTSVSASRELFSRAAALGADTVLVHHGVFWKGDPQPLVGWRLGRMRTLLDSELNLIAYHLPLDRHPEIGNNALAAKAIGLEDRTGFAPVFGRDVAVHGSFAEPIDWDTLLSRVSDFYGQSPLVAYREGPTEIRKVGISCGGAPADLYRAIDLGLDAFVTGEVREWVMNVAREAGIHYLACGHYATERCGIRSLGEHINEELGIRVTWVDIPNPG
ncbi:MAG: Nif3-like dinuclear metal center hexameric protein [Acidobacteriota bacterium]